MELKLELLLLMILFRSAFANFDLYVPEDEVYKLFGIKAQLYYVHDGKVNHNALAFVARVQPEHSILKYIWKVTPSDLQAPYDIEFSLNNASSRKEESESLIQPISTNVKLNSLVMSGGFEVYVNCTGAKTGNLTFEMKLTLHLPYQENYSEKVTVTIKRLKKCEKTESIPTRETASPDLSDQDSPSDTTQRPTSTGGMQQSMSAFYISIAVVIAIIVIILFVCCGWHYRINERHKHLGSEALHRVHMGHHHGNQFLRLDLPNNAQRPPSHSSMVHFSSFVNDLGTDINEIRGKLAVIAIPGDNVTLGELLIKGTFARIYKGSLQDGTSVLVKTVTEAATEEQKRLLLFECSLFRGMQHRNLLTLKNVVLDSSSPVPMVLFHFKEGGNLKHFLQSLKFNETPGSVPGIFSSNLTKFDHVSTQELVEMAIQVAFGMTYLSKRGLVHKDVAARNCVIDNDMKIKITDYALSRDAFPRDYCCLGDSENRPVRWLALESLVHNVYSSASDVWSFGVLLWELQSLAATPYSDIDDFEMEAYLSDGFRLSQPINCPDLLYSIMAGCWHYSPDQRPSFAQLLNLLTDFFAELGDYV